MYGHHKDLVEQFQAQVRAQSRTPEVVQRIADDNRRLTEQVAALKTALGEAEATARLLRQINAELSLELEQARDQLASGGTVTPLRRRH